MKKQQATSNVRQMTLCSRYFARVKNRYVQFPELHLRGKWLADSGFQSGQVVDITCEDQRLIITLAGEQRFESVEATAHQPA